jgi:peptidoglycan/xylan/chitin deacetylase (PgdA/CDA1 family)
MLCCVAGLGAGIAAAHHGTEGSAAAHASLPASGPRTIPEPAQPEPAASRPERTRSEPTGAGHGPDASEQSGEGTESPRGPKGLGKQFRNGMVITGRTPHRLILFTFDDGPDLQHTPKLLDELDRLGIGAVFFLTGERIRPDAPWGPEHAELAREIVRRGHLVANHTVRHVQLPLLDNEEVLAEIKRTEAIFRKVFGGRPWLFRPPGGARSDRVDRLLAERGYTTMMWNLGAGDFQVRSADQVVATWQRVFDRREQENGDRGGIILLHDTHEWSVKAVPRIVAEIRRRNCRLLREGRELYDIVDDPSLFFTPRAGAPAPAEAPPAMPDPDVLQRRQAHLRQQTARRCGQLARR